MSSLSVRCPACHERLAVPSEAAGQSLACPKCGAAVTVADEGNTLIDGEVPDFSYLRKQLEKDDDILVGDDPEDGESALGESPSGRPIPKPAAKTVPPAAVTVVYTPPAVKPAAPVVYTPPPADVPERLRKSRSAQQTKSDTPSVVRTPAWVWPVLAALTLYAVVASGVAAWGWLRPVMPAPTDVKPAR